MPFPKNGNNNRQRKNSQSSYNSRENSMERSYGYEMGSRDSSLDRRQMRRSRFNGRRGSDYQSSRENSTERFGANWTSKNHNDSLTNLQDAGSWRRGDEATSSNTEEIAKLTKQFENSVLGGASRDSRTLFDPSNPTKPIVVNQSKHRPREFVADANIEHYADHQQYSSSVKPSWLKKSSDQYKNMRHKFLLDDLSSYDTELNEIIDNGELLSRWDNCQKLRTDIQRIFEELLRIEMRFCQQEHIEHFFWKLLFYKIIELLRHQMEDCDSASKKAFKEKALEIVDGGTRYLESLLNHLETSHKFQMEEFIGDNAATYKSGLGYVGLALVSAQKLFLFLGDLARYREQINQTNNFGRAKNYYVKAQQIVPKNGRPFNQLALLAVYSVSFASLSFASCAS